jgi:Spy/CpxP family protein refolding chaperone
MKTSVKKTIVLLVLAAFAAPTLSFAAASYPNNKPRPAHHKSHKHHGHKKAAPAQ